MNKVFLYARKSDDEHDTPILSVEEQIMELHSFANREQIEIVDTFIEFKPAVEPGRPIFNTMLSQIEDTDISGILAWHPGILARNNIDGGRIIYLIDTCKLTTLKFPTFWFESTPQGKFMLNRAFEESRFYINELSKEMNNEFQERIQEEGWKRPDF
jgi:DNA invertase Pin-like site-specific DNA recombinase